MRQRNQVETAAVKAKRKGASDDFVELLEREELGNRELTDRNNELGLEKVDLVIHPGGTIPDLVRPRHAIAASRVFARKAATNCREIDLGADLFLAHGAELPEPAKK